MIDVNLFYNWCLGCDNYQKTLRGPICKITNKSPDFVSSCSYYKGNNENLKKSQQKIIETNQKDNSHIVSVKPSVKPTIITKEIKGLPNHLILRNKKIDFHIVYLLLLDFFGAYFIHYFSNLEFFKILAILTASSIPIYGLIYAKTADQSDKITLSKNGLKIENKTVIEWENTFTYIMTKPTDGQNSLEYLVIKKPFEKEIVISLFGLEKTPTELSNLIENYKKL